MNGKRLAAVEHTKFTFDDLKVTFHDNRDGQPNCLALAHAYNGMTNNNYNNSKAIMQFNWNWLHVHVHIHVYRPPKY